MPQNFFLQRKTPLAIALAIVWGVSILMLGGKEAKADYNIFELNTIPPNTLIGPDPSSDYHMFGASQNSRWDVRYLATGTVTQFDRISVPLCRFGGSNGGTIDVEVRTTSTSSPIVASSSLAINSGNVWNTGCTNTYVNATSSVFVFNNNLQWVDGVNVWFTFYYRSTSPSATFFHSFADESGGEGVNLLTYADSTFLGPPNYSNTYHMSMKAFALGVPPLVYNASSSPYVVCDTFDIGCYLSNAGTYLFLPDQSVVDQFGTLTLASSSPFSYMYDTSLLFEQAFGGTASTSVLTLTLYLPGVGTSTIILLDIDSVKAQYPFVDTLQLLIAAFLCILTAVSIFEISSKVFSKSE